MNELIRDHMVIDMDAIICLDDSIEASADPSNYCIPDGLVISDIRNKSPQMIADYDAFVETIEDLLIDYYGLELTYFNDSNDNSRYYNFLAKDENGNAKIKFRFRLMISNHYPHRTELSQKYKKEEKQSPELKKSVSQENIYKMKPYTQIIVVNGKEYSTYEEAFKSIDSKIEKYIGRQ